MRDLIIEIISWVIAALMVVTIAIVGIRIACFLLAPSDQEVQCTSIAGAKWSGDSCYKNGIRINFNGEQEQ